MHTRQNILLLITVIASLVAGFFVYFPIADGDIFWHLAAGREMVQHRALLLADPFSYTTPGIQWIDLHWIFQLVTFILYEWFDYFGLLLFKSIVIAAAVFLLLHPLRTYLSGIFISVLFVYAIFQFRYLIPMRPGIMTLLFMSLYFKLLGNFLLTRNISWLIFTLPIQIIWVNTQGLYMLGPAIAGAYYFGCLIDTLWLKLTKKDIFGTRFNIKNSLLSLGGITVLLLSSLINPYGITGFLFPLKLLTRITPGEMNQFSNTIVENMPLLKMIGTQYFIYVKTFLLVWCAAFFSLFFLSGKLRWIHLTVLAGFSLLAFMAQRNLILFVFAIIPGIKYAVEQVEQKNRAFVAKTVLWGVSGVLIFNLYLAGNAHTALLSSVDGAIAPFCHPVKSVDYLDRVSLSGKVFNADRYGGYLLWETFPKYPVYIDTRLTMRDNRFFSDYLTMLDNPDLFMQTVVRYGIQAVMLPSSLPRYYPVTKRLFTDSTWILAVADGSECLFLKNGSTNKSTAAFDDTDIRMMIQNIKDDPVLKTDELKAEALNRYLHFLKIIGVAYKGDTISLLHP